MSKSLFRRKTPVVLVAGTLLTTMVSGGLISHATVIANGPYNNDGSVPVSFAPLSAPGFTSGDEKVVVVNYPTAAEDATVTIDDSGNTAESGPYFSAYRYGEAWVKTPCGPVPKDAKFNEKFVVNERIVTFTWNKPVLDPVFRMSGRVGG
ncbi:MAG: hypothetical protein Q4A71_03610 [Actinomycetaceae bacterium]|nr:hypothetical protein [Actinomycetaceae bacterium]